MKKHLFLLSALVCILFACKPDSVAPTVKTTTVTEITENSAKSGGEVITDGGADVTSRGICWSKRQNPTINDNRTDDGMGAGSFISDMTDLEDSTTYYVRAYAINSVGVAYGEEINFMTLDDDADDNSDDDADDDAEISLPEVTTSGITGITETSANSGGNVNEDGGAIVTARGICWSTEQNPTTEDNHTTDGNGTGSYTSTLTDLNPNTNYYVRAYATNEKGTAYGEEISFTTLELIVIELPEVKTVSVSDVGINTAVVTGDVISDGGDEVVERGFILEMIDEDEEPVESIRLEIGAGSGIFTYQFTDLIPMTDYSVTAYAINSEGEANGEHITFTTSEEDGFINGHEYVDLGLPSGMKWATQNVGASSPTEAGNYYAWGETATKPEYTEANCNTYNASLDDIAGNPEFDAATAEWGASWRMPTKEDMEELMNNCTWEWEVRDGVGGKKVTGPNGNHIFIPITGYQYGTSLYMQDFGYYWTSTPITNYENYSYDFFFDMELNLSMGFDDRCYGQPVRPVSN